MAKMKGVTPDERLYSAVTRRDRRLVDAALAEGGDPNFSPSSNPHTTFSMAMKWRIDPVIEQLLQHGADPDTRLTKGLTPIFMTTNQNRTGALRLLLDYGADPNRPRQRGGNVYDTALHEASGSNRRSIVSQLLEAGADPLIPDGRNGKLPLDRAPNSRSLEFVRSQLLFHMALPRIAPEDATKGKLFEANDKHHTPLDNPVVWRNFEAIQQKLTEAGEPLTKENLLTPLPSGRIPLEIAIGARQFGKVLDSLREQGEMITADDMTTDDNLSKTLMRSYVVRELTQFENLKMIGSEGFKELVAAIPEHVVANQLPNRHVLNSRLTAHERQQSRAVQGWGIG